MDNKDNLGGGSTNDPGSHSNSNTFNNHKAFSGTHESHSLTLANRDPLLKFMLHLDEPTGEVTDAVNTDDFGSGSTNGLVSTTAGGLWWAGGLRVHISVQGAQRGRVHGTQAHNDALGWTGLGRAMRSYVQDCGGHRALDRDGSIFLRF